MVVRLDPFKNIVGVGWGSESYTFFSQDATALGYGQPYSGYITFFVIGVGSVTIGSWTGAVNGSYGVERFQGGDWFVSGSSGPTFFGWGLRLTGTGTEIDSALAGKKLVFSGSPALPDLAFNSADRKDVSSDNVLYVWAAAGHLPHNATYNVTLEDA